MPDIEKVRKGLEICQNHDGSNCLECPYFVDECVDDLCADALAMLKEFDRLLCKKQNDIDRLCNEISEWKHKYHDRPPKEQEAKIGHWVSVNDGDIVAIDNDGFPERACFCSECKKYLIASDEYAVYGRYCPFCGAKMEGR